MMILGPQVSGKANFMPVGRCYRANAPNRPATSQPPEAAAHSHEESILFHEALSA